jgi:hypothetical protein
MVLACWKHKQQEGKEPMAKYNSDCKNEYAMQLMGECFRNSLKYYKKNVVDYDYFNPVLLMADTK